MIAIINYGLGNLSSIQNMCRYLGVESCITSEEAILTTADKLILPGVGHFQKGMHNLQSSGLLALLNHQVVEQQKPILGICLGAQLMTLHSQEGDVDGLQWIPAQTVRFDASRLNGLKIPHMGWSDIDIQDNNPLWQGLPVQPRFYHVHSYHFLFEDPQWVSATTTYGYPFASAFQRDNIYGVQFHPEKSHKFGMRVLQNFANL